MQQARLLTGVDLNEGELHPLGLGLASVYTARCPDVQGPNQDSCAIFQNSEKSGVLIVADGAGGMPSGDKASYIAVHALIKSLKSAAKSDESLRSAILDGIENAHASIAALGIGAGTTIAIAEIAGNKVRTYHVGDSQIMVIGQKGKIKLFTKSHSPIGYAVEAGLMGEREAIMHEERHIVSNLLGQQGMHIEIGPTIELASKDTLIIASDGLFDNLRSDEIAEACRKGQLLATISTLSEICHRRMNSPKDGEPSKPDDLTFISYRQRASA
jgi:serine/threonine protein phosphatase PrpC